MAEAARPRKRQGKARGQGTDNFCFEEVLSRGSSIEDYITTNISILKTMAEVCHWILADLMFIPSETNLLPNSSLFCRLS